jgi:hypothetical protein
MPPLCVGEYKIQVIPLPDSNTDNDMGTLRFQVPTGAWNPVVCIVDIARVLFFPETSGSDRKARDFVQRCKRNGDIGDGKFKFFNASQKMNGVYAANANALIMQMLEKRQGLPWQASESRRAIVENILAELHAGNMSFIEPLLVNGSGAQIAAASVVAPAVVVGSGARDEEMIETDDGVIVGAGGGSSAGAVASVVGYKKISETPIQVCLVKCIVFCCTRKPRTRE